MVTKVFVVLLAVELNGGLRINESESFKSYNNNKELSE